MGVTPFPSEPWDLHGHGLVTLGLAPAATVRVPAGYRPVTLAGRAVVCVALLTYTEPSPLTYHEVLATVLVRRGVRFRVHITDIRVDSPTSRDGGRALWAIPKELADFEDHGRRAVGVAAATLHRIRGRLTLPVRFRLAQPHDDGIVVTPIRGSVSLSPARAAWEFDPSGPFAHLAGLRPLGHVLIRRLHLVFGPADR